MNLFEKAKANGLTFDGAQGFMAYETDDLGNITVDFDQTADNLAQDAALTTAPNVNIPAALTTYLDPQVVPILFSSMATTKVFKEGRKGSWTDTSFQFPVEEYVGGVTGYGDFVDNVTSDVNNEFVERGNFIFQTVLQYGDLEEAVASRAKLGLASQKQRSAAFNIAKAHNNINLYGIAGRNIYGMLNDPNLNSAIQPISVTIGGSNYSTWADKEAHGASDLANYIYNDVSKLYGELADKNGGNVDANSPMILGISNTMARYLNATNTYGLTALGMLKANYPNLKVVQVPELTSGGTNTLYLTVPELFGVRTAEFSYSEKMAFGRVVAGTSSFRQKVRAASSGFILKRPSLIARMTGI